MKTRELWKSKAGFVLAAAGSAVGLVNIWRFPYVVGQYGGAAFIFVYLCFLVVIGFPVLLSEVAIGRTAKGGPSVALGKLSGKFGWDGAGMAIAAIGFIVSSFYSVIAGWVVGYLVLAIGGRLEGVTTVADARALFGGLVGSATWTVGFHFVFMALAVGVLLRGVQKGIEWLNKWVMPLLVVLLVVLAIYGLCQPGGGAGLTFLFRPDWKALTPWAILTALGHAFFTLSLGQGTMITYGSYLSGKENIVRTCAPVIILDTVISLLAAVAVLTLVFAAGEAPTAGEGLLFYTLPVAFAKFPGGSAVAIIFFLLVLFAAITSQISAMEPAINYLMVRKGKSRRVAATGVGIGAFCLGLPSALSFNWLSYIQVGGKTFFGLISDVTSDLLIPLGGLTAVLFVGWVWKFDNAYDHLFMEGTHRHHTHRTLYTYLNLCIKWVAPILIALIFLTNLA